MAKKEKTITLNEREVEVLKKALDNQKTVVRIGAMSQSQVSKEKAINELYNIESIEKKVK
jgi:hypothetical protein